MLIYFGCSGGGHHNDGLGDVCTSLQSAHAGPLEVPALLLDAVEFSVLTNILSVPASQVTTTEVQRSANLFITAVFNGLLFLTA